MRKNYQDEKRSKGEAATWESPWTWGDNLMNLCCAGQSTEQFFLKQQEITALPLSLCVCLSVSLPHPNPLCHRITRSLSLFCGDLMTKFNISYWSVLHSLRSPPARMLMWDCVQNAQPCRGRGQNQASTARTDTDRHGEHLPANCPFVWDVEGGKKSDRTLLQKQACDKLWNTAEKIIYR